jgi:hypothetical protein
MILKQPGIYFYRLNRRGSLGLAAVLDRLFHSFIRFDSMFFMVLSGRSRAAADDPAFARDLPGDLPLQRHDLRPFLHTGVACVSVDLFLLSMQQFRCLGDVRDIRRCDHDGVNQFSVPIRADVGFHPEIPLVALLCLVHFRVALA